jgi:hypothetical protein
MKIVLKPLVSTIALCAMLAVSIIAVCYVSFSVVCIARSLSVDPSF